MFDEHPLEGVETHKSGQESRRDYAQPAKSVQEGCEELSAAKSPNFAAETGRNSCSLAGESIQPIKSAQEEFSQQEFLSDGVLNRGRARSASGLASGDEE